jgi:hypothetical protein
VVQKFLLGRGNTEDVAVISTAISVWSNVKSRLSLERELHFEKGDHDSEREWASIDALISRMVDLPEFERKIQASMDSLTIRLGSSTESAEDAITTHGVSIDDTSQQGYRWSINPE